MDEYAQHGEPWVDCELEFLREHWGSLPTLEIASRLGRSHRATTLKAWSLGLGKEQRYLQRRRAAAEARPRADRKRRSERELRRIKQVVAASYMRLTARQIGRLLGVSRRTVIGHAWRMGLRKGARHAA